MHLAMNSMNAKAMTCLALLLACLTSTSFADEPTFKSIFDGQTFDGWEGDTKNTWRIENGTITAGSHDVPAPRNEFLATVKEYENFELRLKFKVTGDDHVNAGVQFRTKRIPDHHEVSGFQADISPEYDGHLYDESRRRTFLAKPEEDVMKRAQAAVGDDGWNTYRIRAEGKRIQLWFNGVQTVDYTETDPKIEPSGIIAIQIHGKMKAVIAYKAIEICELPNLPK